MVARISAEIVAFPRAAPIDAPALRLQRALAGLEAALAYQRESVATWLATMEELRGSVRVLAGSVGHYQHSLAQLGTQVAGLGDAARRIEATLDGKI
jgi:hypothetical protein